MRQTLNASLICFTFMCTINIAYSKFLGGTISWVPDTNAIRFTYRLSWEKGTGPCGPSCSTKQSGSSTLGLINSSSLSSLYWKYKDGSTAKNVSDINYYVTSVSKTNQPGWEQGENSFTYNSVSQMNKNFTIFLNSIPWVRSSTDSSDKLGYMETLVDLRVRSDTAKPNSSPYVSVPAFIGIAYGCSTRIRLPAEDPDGDRVRCRFAFPFECGQACTDLPKDSVKLNKANCTLTIYAFSELGLNVNDKYRLAITIEDYPHGLIDVGGENFTRRQRLSKIPIQFTVTIAPGSEQCDGQDPLLLNPFGETNYRTFLSTFTVNKLNGSVNTHTLSIPSNLINDTDLVASVPRFTTFTKEPNSHETRISISLYPRPSQYGYTQFCFWLLQMSGITSKCSCKVYTVYDDSQCTTSTCKNNGTCLNLYNVTNDICDCRDGFKPRDCSTNVDCVDEPCENQGQCLKNGTKTKCSCPNDFVGFYCEEERNHCDTSPCRNNATCLDLQTDFKCLCTSKFSGKTCADTNGDSKNKGNTDGQRVPAWIAALASIGGLLIVVGLGICIYKLRPDKGTGNEAVNGNHTRRVKQKVNKVQSVENKDYS